MKLNVNAVCDPVVAGTPDSLQLVPLAVIVIHVGSVPEVTVHVTEVVGPTVDSVTEYATPSDPAGSAHGGPLGSGWQVVVLVSGMGANPATVMVNSPELVTVDCAAADAIGIAIHIANNAIRQSVFFIGGVLLFTFTVTVNRII